MDDTKKYSLIINYPYFFNIGGIEKYLYSFIKYCIDKEVRVIWLCETKYEIAESFKSILLSDKIERVPIKRCFFGWFKLEALNLKKDEIYILFCTSPIYMCINQDIIRQYSDYRFYPIYAIASETDNTYFLEDYFNCSFIKNRVRHTMGKMIENWDLHNAVRCFNIHQLNSLEKKYSIKIQNKEEKVLGVLKSQEDVSESFLRTKYRSRDIFTIITVSRFDFPHKAYLLGLIRAFGVVKVRYPQIHLQIIGYGPHKNKVIDEIEKLPPMVKQSIELVGEVSPDNLNDYFKKADLNISVAGAATGGARVGTLTLVARNYCEDVCEVYGYYDESSNMTTSLIPGNDVEPYIEEVLSMNENDYVQKCLAGYQLLKTTKTPNPDYLFKTSEAVDLTVSGKEMCQMKIIRQMILFRRLLDKSKNVFKFR